MVKVSRKASTKKPLIIALASILILGGLLFLLEKLHITNFYTNKTNTSTTDTRPQEIKYTPPTKDEQVTINNQKSELTKSDQESTPKISSAAVEISTATQDNLAGPVYVNAVVTGTANGTCNLKLTKDGVIVQKTASVIIAGTYYACDGFEVPYGELSPGRWVASLTVSNDKGTSGEVSKNVEVR